MIETVCPYFLTAKVVQQAIRLICVCVCLHFWNSSFKSFIKHQANQSTVWDQLTYQRTVFYQLCQLRSAVQLRLSNFNGLSLSTPFHFRFHNLIKWPFCSVLWFRYIISKQNVCHSPLILISDNIILNVHFFSFQIS